MNKAAMRERLCGEQGWRCCYCGVRFGAGDTKPTIEHIRAQSKGGDNRWENLAAACVRCNGLRGHGRAVRFFNRQRWQRPMLREMAQVDPDYVPAPAPRACLADRWPAGGAA